MSDFHATMSDLSKWLDDYYLNFLSTAVMDYFALDETVSHIYHYTAAEALMKILEGNILRATNVQFMNDINEIDYSIELFHLFVNKKEHDKMKKVNDYILNFYNEHFIKLLKSNLDRTYISSFSTNKDSLHLWNFYGKNDGYAIGFQLEKLMNSFQQKDIKLFNMDSFNYKEYSFYFGKVLYDNEKQKHFFNSMTDGLNTFLKKIYETTNTEEKFLLEQKRITISQLLTSAIYNMKFEPHRIEDEYRITIIPDKSFAGRKYSNKNGIITPYIEYNGDLFMDAVIIGPKIKDDVSMKGIQLYLENYKKNKFRIWKSNIEVR